MDMLAALFVAVELSDSNEHEITKVAHQLLPDCWDITLQDDGMIRVQHGHKPPCNQETVETDDLMEWTKLAAGLVKLAGIDEVMDALKVVRADQNPALQQFSVQA